MSHCWGRECDFFEISVFGCPIEWTQNVRTPLKTPGIDSTHWERFKNQKIIKIGSREKKLQLFKVGDFSKIFESPGFSYSKTEILLQKLSQQIGIYNDIPKNSVWLYSFSFESYPIIFGMPNLHQICHIGKIFDFRFFDFFHIFSSGFAKKRWKYCWFLHFHWKTWSFVTFSSKSYEKIWKKSKNRKSNIFPIWQI